MRCYAPFRSLIIKTLRCHPNPRSGSRAGYGWDPVIVGDEAAHFEDWTCNIYVNDGVFRLRFGIPKSLIRQWYNGRAINTRVLPAHQPMMGKQVLQMVITIVFCYTVTRKAQA